MGMRILDRQRYWAYFKAYVVCFTSLVGLYIVIDTFSNLDEFAKRADGIGELFPIMGRYYLVHMSEIFDRLCGVIGMMAAIFTVTWMQKNNELLAMLAAGISTQRVVVPVLVSAVFVSGFAIINQEFIMPNLAEELQRPHADDGSQKVLVSGRVDSRGIYMHGNDADRKQQTVLFFFATFPVSVFGTLHELDARQARYIPPDDTKSPMQGGWLLRGARLNVPVAPGSDKYGVLTKLDNDAGFPPPVKEVSVAGGEMYFLKTGINFQAITRKRQWYNFANTADLIRGLSDPANEPEKVDIAVFLHNRLLRPGLSLVLLFMSLPQVLGGYGRNMFINLGLSLGTAAIFYGICFMTQYFGTHSVVSPELSAWGPMIIFGSFAAGRWGAIRT